jgi:putative ABC transport system permease protein
MSKALLKDVFRSIVRTKARFISIVAIVALGISVFAGIKATAPNLKDTAEKYFLDNNLMDINIISTIGLTDSDIFDISRVSGVEAVMPSKFADALIEINGKKIIDIEGAEFSCRAMSIDLDMINDRLDGVNDAAYMNRVLLKEGSYPKKDDECLVDSSAMTSTHKFAVGDVITLIGDSENLANKLRRTQFKVVGIVETPLYISVERGNTLVGSGKLGNFIFVPQENFVTNYYSNVYVSVSGAFGYKTFSDEYRNYVSPVIKEIQEIGERNIPARALALSAEYTPKVANGEAELAVKELEAEQKLAEGREQVEQIKYYAENGEAELAEKRAEYENSLSAAQRDLFSGKNQYNAGVSEYNAKLAEYNAARAKADEHPNARQEYAEAVEALAQADKNIKNAEKTLEASKTALKEAEALQDESSLIYLIYLYATSGSNPDILAILEQARTEGLPAAIVGLDALIVTGELALNSAKMEYAAKKVLVDAAGEDIKKLDELDTAYQKLKEAEAKLSSGSSEIAIGELKLSMKQMELKYELTLAEEKLAQAKAKAATIDDEFAKIEADARKQLQSAKYDLAAAKNMLASLDTAQWYVSGRDSLPGHVEYDQSADNMKAFSAVFPVFFFLIAAVVSLTTMARMVEEERIQLGTLKALGYGAGAIAAKYLIYAVLASLIGSAIGLSIGFVLFPRAIYDAYSIMFTTPPIILTFRASYAVLGTLIVTLAVAAATLLACRNELATNPAQLMRPKAPKKGKRVFLERVDFIWKRLSFSSKVTVRNLFRNKKRFFMTLIGISGCTALLLTGLGIKDSISAISTKQFGAGGISIYDTQIVLNDMQENGTNGEETLEDILKDVRIKDAMLTYMKSLSGTSERAKDVVLPVSIVVPNEKEQLSKFIKLQSRTTGAQFELSDEGVLITEKFAAKTKTQAGDEILIALDENTSVKLKVAGVVENYAFHYVYMSENLYETTFGETPVYNFVTAMLTDSIKTMEETPRSAEKSKLASDLMKRDDVSVVVYTEQASKTFDNIIGGLDTLVMIFIVCAGALAFVVLYNLSNININERLRELATIKVLGFYDREVSSYIYRENILLTVLGTALGLLLGIPLHKFVINVAEVNIVMFGRSIDTSSMIIAGAVTVIFSILVSIIMHRKLKKISMVESLKSVE